MSPLDAALRYAARGWFVFPVRANKHPFTDHGHKDATTDATQIARWWAQWPDAQVGVSCEPSGVAVIDLDYDPTQNKDGPSAWSIVLQDHGDINQCGLIATTPRGGRHLFFKMPEGGVGSRVDVLPKSGIDVRAVGGYVIVPSPASPGRDWRTGDPFDVDTDGVGDCEAMPQWMRDFIGSKSGRMGSSAGGESSAPMFLDEPTVRSIKDALSHLDNDPHDVWLQVGMALKSTGAQEQAYDLWCEWSASSSKFQPKAQRRRWNSFKEFRWDGSEITLGTLFHLAKDAGWSPSMQQELAITVEHAPVGPAESGDREPAAAVPLRAFPSHLLHGAGLLSDMVQWMLANSPRRQPALCLGSAIASLGALLGRRVQTPTGLRTNIYALGIAETASGKNATLQLPKRLLVSAGLLQFIGPSEWKSDSGVRASLTDENTRSHVALVDEFTKFLQAVSGPRAAGHQLGIKRALLELFTTANDLWLPAAYADTKLHPAVPIVEPHLCVYGTGVPAELFASLDRGALTDGFLGRLLVFFSDEQMPARQEFTTAPPPTELVDRVRELERQSRRVGDLHGECRTVTFEAAAAGAWRQIHGENDSRVRLIRRGDQPALADLWVRFPEHVAKLALIRSMSIDATKSVDAVDILWAQELAEWCADRLVAEAADRIADSEVEAAALRVRRFVREAGPDGLSMNDLTRRTQWMQRSQRKDVLASLVEAGDIEVVTMAASSQGGRPRTILRAI